MIGGSLFIYLILFVFLSYEYQLPKEIPKCDRTSIDFNECMVKSMTKGIQYFQKGSKEFGIPSITPLKIPKLEIPAESGKAVALNQNYENLEFYGIENSIIQQANVSLMDEKNCHYELISYLDRSIMEADFKLSGQILVVPISGAGRCNVTLGGITNKHTTDCERYKKNGKIHLRLKNYKMDMSVKTCEFHFPNIIPGNEQLAEQLHKTINENSLEIFKDVKRGFEQVMAKIHEASANKIFAKIPEGDLFVN